MLEAPVALISLVDRDRQFFKSSVGLGEPWNTTREVCVIDHRPRTWTPEQIDALQVLTTSVVAEVERALV